MENEQMLAWKAKGDNVLWREESASDGYLDGIRDFHEKMREEVHDAINKTPENPDDYEYGFQQGLREAHAILENLKP